MKKIIIDTLRSGFNIKSEFNKIDESKELKDSIKKEA